MKTKVETEPPPSRESGQQTAKAAAAILVAAGEGFFVPTAKQREALILAFVRKGFVIYGKAFDVVKCTADVDYSSPESIAKYLDEIVLYEIKSTNKTTVLPDFRRYFFSLSTAELLVAQNLGNQYRFAFVNTRTRAHIELSLQEVFGRARGIYPTWSIQF